MTEEFLTFKSFTDTHSAREVAEKLKEQNIPFRIEDTSSPIDPVIIGSALDADLRIKLRQKDFQRANEILETYYSDQLYKIESDYYLFDFTDHELNEILKKPDEWGPLDYQLAQKILQERGKKIEPEEIEALKLMRIKEIAKSDNLDKSWIILGYFIAVLLGPIGIFFGSMLMTSKKTLPNGQVMYSYNNSIRKHGQNILIISVILTILLLFFKLHFAK